MSNIAFRIAKANAANPVQTAVRLAEDLVGYLGTHGLPVIVETAGPYLNLRLSNEFYGQLLGADLTQEIAVQNPERLMLEYIGANVAKRLHAGHMRNLNIGDSLRRILALGHPDMVTDNHWGDWGVQFGVLLWAYKAHVDPAAYASNPLDELQRLYVWGNAQEGVAADWANLVRQEFVKLEQGDEQNRQLWEEFAAVSKVELSQDLALFGVPPTDLEQGESFYEEDMEGLRAFMDEHRLWCSDGEARYIDYDKLAGTWKSLDAATAKRVAGFGRCYLVSSHGYTTYAFRDVAARLQWARDLKIDRAVTVTDHTQSHNFDQAFGLISYLATLPEFAQQYGADTAKRLTLNRLVHVGYGFLQLTSGKMSTRKGTGLRLPELVGEVASAASQAIAVRSPDLPAAERDARAQALALASLKWADLNRDPATDVTLDPAAITRFEGNTGTYQLYTYARLRSVLRRAGSTGATSVYETLTGEQQAILAHMYALPAAIAEATATYRPNVIASYTYELSDMANRWYVASPKLLDLPADDAYRLVSIALIERLTALHHFCLGLLGIETLEEL